MRHAPPPVFLSYLKNPWVYFLVFVAGNTLLSYFDLPVPVQVCVGIVALVLPSVLLLAIAGRSGTDRSPWEQEFLPAIPKAVWLGLAFLAIAIRCYHLGTLMAWPHYDEGIYGYYGLKVQRIGVDRFFYADSHVPPLYFILLTRLFDWMGPSFRALWSLPALLSLAAVPLSYLGARMFLSRSMAFLVAALEAIGFWAFGPARFSQATAWVPMGEAGAFLLLGGLLREIHPVRRRLWALGLALWTGLFFYAIYLHWFSTALLVLGVAMGDLYRRSRKDLGLFLAAFLLAMGPFLYFEFRSFSPVYLHYLWVGGSGASFSANFQVAWDYIRVLLWGVPLQCFTYQPVWGGFLNPILGSLFLLGAVECLRDRASLMSRSLLLLLVYFLLPGLLSRELEPFRIWPAAAAVLPLAARGAFRLLQNLPSPRRTLLLGLLGFFSFGIDAYHLTVRYERLWDAPSVWQGFKKSLERARAQGYLEALSKTQGPGFLFSNFLPGLSDRTLDLASYPYNILQNPHLKDGQARWAAVITNVHFQPFLAARFPHAHAYALSKGLDHAEGGWMLFVIPLEGGLGKDLAKWRGADAALRPFIDAVICYVRGQPFEAFAPLLEKAKDAFQGDPFLESSYDEMMADLWIKAGHVADHRAQDSLRDAVQRGYPAAHLFCRLGVLELSLGEKDRAQRDLEKATKAPLDLTDSRTLLSGPSFGKRTP